MGDLPNLFTSNELLDNVPAVPHHPDDAYVGVPSSLSVIPAVFANIIPRHFHQSYVRKLLVPMFKFGQEKVDWLHGMEQALDDQFLDFDTSTTEDNPEPFPYWQAELQPLGDIHPVLALLALVKFMGIKIDFSLCAAQHFCWSFILATTFDRSRINPNAAFQLVIGPNTYQLPLFLGPGDDFLHTHSLAEIGIRQGMGGTKCHHCNLWESAPAYDLYHDDYDGPPDLTPTMTIGGITTGASIGRGRYSIGSLCYDCRMMQTCTQCERFVCHNCVFSDPTGPTNPHVATDPTEIHHLRFTCEQGHGAECHDCTSIGSQMYFECDECATGRCLRCNNPTGLRTATDLYGGSMEVYDASDPNDGDIKLPYCRKTALVLSRYAALSAFKPRTPQIPGSDGVVFLAESRMFEYCDACDSALCRECIASFRSKATPLVYTRNFPTMYTRCSNNCGRVYCPDCEEEFSYRCKACKTWVCCDDCEWETWYLGAAQDGLAGKWCPESGCMSKSKAGALGNLKGPWEDGWEGENNRGRAVSASDSFEVVMRALREGGFLDGGVQEDVLEALRKAGEVVAARPEVADGGVAPNFGGLRLGDLVDDDDEDIYGGEFGDGGYGDDEFENGEFGGGFGDGEDEYGEFDAEIRAERAAAEEEEDGEDEYGEFDEEIRAERAARNQG